MDDIILVKVKLPNRIESSDMGNNLCEIRKGIEELGPHGSLQKIFHGCILYPEKAKRSLHLKYWKRLLLIQIRIVMGLYPDTIDKNRRNRTWAELIHW